ncbi:ribonuclease H1 domain-containing protein [Gemelliphila palaticanis]|uniref:ribonuclease H n=1 Tax=Gemelliphila palaticanis TaxID=81950 RepID=A0ABX2T024_9BACL|nr:ribonuclease H family protein [Gemella palaticanis]MBF0714834.1 ribonuclease H family protein [Gemella palaticanis]NYS46764.1 viroplasmin family protein [Gemella palaticanis]
MSKYYAVKVGKIPGIYNTWDECKMQVMGYKGAVYKSFQTLEDARLFLENDINYNNNKKNSEKPFNSHNLNVENYAYIDGSYDNEKKIYGSGIVIVIKDKKITKKISGNKEDIRELRNVAGEIEAVKYVLSYCLENNINEITIYYDYAGIESWATGDWKTNLEYTKNYAIFAREIMKKINVHFVKVKAHSGVELNELADNLAKEAIKEFNPNNNLDGFIFGTYDDIDEIKNLKENKQISFFD